MMKYLFLLILLFVALNIPLEAATWKIHYAKPEDPQDKRTTYPLSVLNLALEHTGVNYNLIPSNKVLSQGKSIQLLKANREVSLIWSMTDEEREEELLPVRIPIYKGLIGWRIFLVKAQNLNTFKLFNSIQELRQYTLVQGHDWPDTKILQSNGFEVVTSSDYLEMFDMVRLDRAGFFPRSIVEIWAEYDHVKKGNQLVVEPHLAVRYPTATYFFFNKKNLVLKNLIETGLRRAIKSGKFNKLFFEVHNEYIKRAGIDKRIIFELDNPILPSRTPIDDPELWYSGTSFNDVGSD